MRITVLVTSFLILSCAYINAEEFKKISFFHPYHVMKHFLDTTLDPASYFGQLDSFGVNMLQGSGDTVSTRRLL